ncbi:MAG: zinc ribbon domain-containing protein [Dehalococcoidia bacterium]
MPEGRALFTLLVRLIVQILILSVINLILIGLPMLRAVTIPGSPITLTAIISLVIGAIMIGVLLGFRQDFIPMLQRSSRGFPQAATIASSLIVLVIIITTYTMFEAAVRPLMFQFGWAYPVIFLIISLWPLITVIITLYSSGRQIADWAAEKIMQNTTNCRSEDARCISCGTTCERSAKFCPACGVCLVPQTENIIRCKACGAVNKSSYKYCLSCGIPIEDEQFETRVSI